MKLSKQIMNPARIQQLAIIQDAGETNANYVAFRSSKKVEQINLSLKRFAEYGLIKHTGGGYFEISEKGDLYLNQLIDEGEPILCSYKTDRERQKYETALNFIKSLDSGEPVSVSMLQRKIRMGYGLATAILQKLWNEGYLEAYEQSVGHSVNGVKKDGHLKLFKTK